MRKRGEHGTAGGAGRAPRPVGARAVTALLLAVPVLSGCGSREEEETGMRLRFEDQAEPGVFQREGRAVRDDPDGADGLWAAVPGLPRPERAEIVNLDTGDKATVALFRGPGDGIRLSNAAADALGIAAAPVPVRVTALRSVPEIEY